MSDLLIRLDERGALDAQRTGGKGANLARLTELGVPVPAGFVVTTDAYRATIGANGLDGATAEELRVRLPGATMSDELTGAVREALARLGAGSVAVRSSATSEDLADASFAGQHDTLLDVVGVDAVLDAIRTCWASLWSARGVDYRRRRDWTGDVAMAVVVQALVRAEWAGVLFTVDPVSGDAGTLVLESVRGLGEALVSGEAMGERVTIDKASGRVTSGTTGLPVPVIVELADLGRRVESAFGAPQDIEWAHAANRTYLVQARAITTLGRRAAAPRPRRSFGRLQRAMAPNIREHVPVAPYPLDLSMFFHPLWQRIWTELPRLGVRTPPIDRVFTEVAEDVVQVVPPRLRLTPRIVMLPIAVLRSVRRSPQDWLEQARRLTAAARERERDVATASDEELIATVRDLSARQVDLAPARFAAFPRGLLARAMLGFVVRRAVGRERATVVERELLADVPCVTTDADRERHAIAAEVRADPELRGRVASSKPVELPGVFPPALSSRVSAFLDRYGDRETTLPSAGFPTWRDEPTLIYGLLKALVAGSDGRVARPGRQRDPRAEVERGLGRGRFGLRALAFRPLFRRVLPAARAFVAFREDSHYLLFAPFAAIRRVALELGRRLVARGALDAPEDVFYLHASELDGDGLRDRVARRREARRSVEGREATVPAELLVSPGDELRGTPVSAGRSIGAARIIRGEAGFDTLARGEILVAPYTNPTWTPLFAIAAGVVVESGGAASHAAIVAREYGIPGVMGVAGATSRLHDGERIVVDGSTGTVAVVPAGAHTTANPAGV